MVGTQGRIQSPILAPDTRNYSVLGSKGLWRFVHDSHAICVVISEKSAVQNF